jgi:prophage tail gpP-like protein
MKSQDPSPGFYSRAGSVLVERLHKENNLSVRSLRDKKMLRRLARTRMEQSITDNFDMTVTVNGHRPFDGGPLYTVDTVISCRFDPWDVDDIMYIIGRTFKHDSSSGETTELELIPSGIWLAQDHDAVNDGDYQADLMQRVYW